MTLRTPEDMVKQDLVEWWTTGTYTYDAVCLVRKRDAEIAKELRNCHGLDKLMEIIKELEEQR